MSKSKAAAILERDKKVLGPSLARSTDLVVERGEGCYLFTVDGRRYIDFVSGIATNPLGHCHPRVIDAAINQMRKVIHASANAVHYEANVLLAEKLTQIAPGNLAMCFFSNSGAEAVEGAIKLARYVTRRPIILSFLGGFHGRTYGALSVTSSKVKYRSHYEPFLPGIYTAPYPYCFRCPLGHSQDSCSLDCVSYLKWMLKTAVPATEVAAILVEPILGEGGYVVPPDGFLPAIREICDAYGMLLILDEIQSGFGRTGRMFASEHWGVVPDIMTVAKAVASGFPLSAVLSTAAIMGQWSPGAHGGTFGGNPVACAAGLASIDVIEEERLPERAARLGEKTLARLHELQRQHGAIGDVRGRGLMVALEIVDASGNPDKEKATRILKECLERDLLLMACGFEDQVIRLMPPLNVPEEVLETALAKISAAFESLGK